MEKEKEIFINYLKTEKRYSPHTILSYSNDLSQFIEFSSSQYEITNIQDISRQVIRSWVVGMVESDYEPRSIRRKVSCIKSYFKFAKKMGKISSDPSQQIVTPKTNKRLPTFVESKSMSNLFENINFTEDYSGRRDLLMISLFYETGIRLSELIGIQETDINRSRKELKILGKRNKERLIPITDEMIMSIDNLIVEKKKMGFDNIYLLLTDRGKKLYPKFVYRKINFYLSAVTNISKKSPHVLRHTFATQMLNNGAELNAIKEILGHSSLAATQIYTHNSIEKLKEIYKNTHPKG